MTQERGVRPERNVLYIDLCSPYVYLALERAERVLGRPPVLEPILAGAIFVKRGWGSWAQTEEHADRVAELNHRARCYGLPPFRWPQTWPGNGLRVMRAATVAKEQGAVAAFARGVLRREFVAGQSLSDALIGDAAAEAGLEPGLVLEQIETPRIKQALRAATDHAWAAGVRGVPTLMSNGVAFYGDDQLEAAALAATAR
jgi:2-hydroxychromene-2-carboxylate isomerase